MMDIQRCEAQCSRRRGGGELLKQKACSRQKTRNCMILLILQQDNELWWNWDLTPGYFCRYSGEEIQLHTLAVSSQEAIIILMLSRKRNETKNLYTDTQLLNRSRAQKRAEASRLLWLKLKAVFVYELIFVIFSLPPSAQSGSEEIKDVSFNLSSVVCVRLKLTHFRTESQESSNIYSFQKEQWNTEKPSSWN